MPESTKYELDLNLDLNLPDAPKNDDRLKTEDKNNEKMNIPTMEPVIKPKTIEQKIEEPTNEQQEKPVVTESVENLFASPIDDTPGKPNKILQNKEVVATDTIQETKPIEEMPEIPTMIEPVVEITEPTQAAVIVEKQTTIVDEAPQIQNTEVQIEKPATKIEDIPISSQSIDGNVPEASSLQKDMKIIEELE